jgi:hypothetical protein
LGGNQYGGSNAAASVSRPRGNLDQKGDQDLRSFHNRSSNETINASEPLQESLNDGESRELGQDVCVV